MLECFDDRNHICIVTELLSVSVFDFLKENDYAPFPEAHIQKFAKQLLDSVACAPVSTALRAILIQRTVLHD